MADAPPQSRPRADDRVTPTIPLMAMAMLAGITLFWGLNWPAMKIVVTEVEPFAFRVVTLTTGAVGLFGLALLLRTGTQMKRDRLIWLIVAGILNISGWHLFSAFGVSMIDAGRSSIIAFTMPLWASLLGAIFLAEKFTPLKVLGLLMGLVGLGLLMGPDLIALGHTPLGTIIMLGAAFTWACGTVLNKWVKWDMPVIAVSAWQMIFGTGAVFIGSLFFGDLSTIEHMSGDMIWAALYTATIPMVLCYYWWYKVLTMIPASIASIGVMCVPVVGVSSSALLLGERLRPTDMAAMLVVTIALAMVLVLPGVLNRNKK